jgi:hypothetical protein
MARKTTVGNSPLTQRGPMARKTTVGNSPLTQRGPMARKTTVGNLGPKKSSGLPGKINQSMLGQPRFGKSTTSLQKKGSHVIIPPLVVTPSEDPMSCLDEESNHLRSVSPDLSDSPKSKRNQGPFVGIPSRALNSKKPSFD